MTELTAVPGLTIRQLYLPPQPAFRSGVPLFLGHLPGQEGDAPLPLRAPSQLAPVAARSSPILAAAVRGFFANGGRRCALLPWDPAQADPVRELRRALAAGAALEDVDLICAPEIVDNGRFTSDQSIVLQNELLDHCRRIGTRFAILDPVYTRDVALVREQREALRGDRGALYHTWLLLDAETAVPPCGHVAGVYALIDRSEGVYRAPANVELTGVVDLLHNPDRAQLAALTAANVNCLLARPGRGIRVWGGRTLSRDSAWQPIAVRRLFITLRRRLEQFMTPLTFEPNDVRLWIRISRELTAYLDTLYRQGALRGETAEHAFYVKCDAETNTPAIIDAGQVVAEIGLAPAATNEFIVVRLVHGEQAAG